MSRFVLVTGSSKGIGKAIALKLASQGFNIVVHCRSNREAAEETCQQIQAMGVETRLLQFDVSDRATAQELLTADIEAHGAYYGVVCNAGITDDVAFPAMEDEQWDSVIHTNLDGFYNVMKPAVMPMVSARKGGRIVTIASVSGVLGNRGQVNYSASKAGLIGATKSLALELAKRKITVNCVAPGLIETDIIPDHVPIKEITKMIPLRRMGNVDEVAATVGFLFSEEAGYMTRQVLCVDGGLS